MAFTGVSGNGKISASVAFRPEDVVIHDTASEQGEIAANVYEVEPLGAFTIVDVNIGEKILKVQAPGQPQYQLGQAIRLGLDRGKCHLFDAETGKVQ
jgi:multiple sugar transport system ATP-binding protein